MSSRQPIIEINGLTIARDEIVGFHDFEERNARETEKTKAARAVELINGKIVPLSRTEMDRVKYFFEKY